MNSTTDIDRPSDIVRATAATIHERSKVEHLASSRWLTFAVMCCEMFELGVIGAIVDYYVAGMIEEQKPFIDHGLSGIALLGVLAAVQYILGGLELAVRRRNSRTGFTLPIVLLPFGRTLRFALVAFFCALVLVPKLSLYFLCLTLGLPVMIVLSMLGITWAERFLDLADVFFEPAERATNHLFNLLHFNKIEVTGNGFNSLFNLQLFFWCVNN